MSKRISFVLTGMLLGCWCLLAPFAVKAYAVSAYSTIQGEDYDENYSRGVSTSWENGGKIQSLGWIDSGDYACYKNVSFSSGASKLTLRYSKRCTPSVTIKVVLDRPNGDTLTNFTISSATGQKWTDFKTASVSFDRKVNGTHDVYLVFSSMETREQLLHLDWFSFTKGKDSDTDSSLLPPAGLEVTDSHGVKYKVLSDRKSVEVVEIPRTMGIFDTEDELSMIGTYDGGKVTVKMKVTKVAANAAKNCSNLEVVYFGRYVTIVGKNAFKGCRSLYTIVFRSKNAKGKINPAAFYDAKKNTFVYAPSSNLSYLKKHLNSDKKIKKKQFRYKKLQSVG